MNTLNHQTQEGTVTYAETELRRAVCANCGQTVESFCDWDGDRGYLWSHWYSMSTKSTKCEV